MSFPCCVSAVGTLDALPTRALFNGNDNHNSKQVAQRRPVVVLVGELPRGVAYAVSVDVDFY